jgi:hypothetical protein
MKRLLIPLLFFLLAGSLLAQDSLTLTDAQHLSELTGQGEVIFRAATISPDGTTIAWLGAGEGICFYTFDNGTTECVSWSEEFRPGNNTLLEWSPDSQKLAFTEDTFVYGVDSDIRVYDRATDTFSNLTDDEYLGSWFRAEQPILLDYLPVWNHVTGDLYFFRSVYESNNDRGPGLTLYRLGPESVEPELVVDLSSDIRAPFPVFRRPAISEDGTRMAIGVVSQRFDQPADGVWVVDLATGEAEQIAHRNSFNSALPELIEEGDFVPYNLVWRGDHLIVEAVDRRSGFSSMIMSLFYELDPETEQLTALVDLSGFDSMAEFASGDMPEGGHSGVYLLPRAGVVQGDSFIYLHTDLGVQGGAAISALPLPNGKPELLGTIEDFHFGQPDLPSVSDDGTRAIFYGYLLTFDGE